MGEKPTFSCWKCKKDSKYGSCADPGDVVIRMMTLDDQPEKRTYYCEHCGKANEIELLESEWEMIDLVEEGS
jgi:transcription elongation factor Elf1